MLNRKGLKVFIALNTAWNIVNFRAGLIRAMISAGYEVVAVAPPDNYVSHIKSLGCRYIPLSMNNKGTNPWEDLLLFWRFYRLMRAEKPDVYLGYTVKPNVYGSLAAHMAGVPVINNIAGLGSVFIRSNWLSGLVKILYRLALSRSKKVFFQNEDDRTMFVDNNLVSAGVADCLPGSGVDLEKFSPTPLPKKLPIRFLLIARMLWDKGIGEFVEAARILKHNGVNNVEFCLLGFLDVKNPSAISYQEMDEWVAEGVVRYLGTSEDVRKEISESHCIVLPSYYREGTPRTLLEAAAMARPIVTTDSVGCREVVDDGVNGFLCKPRDAHDLAEKMARIAELSHAEREAMGLKGREKVEREFDENIVINKYLDEIASILS